MANWHWYAVALVVLLLDQWTKTIALAHLRYGVPVEINPLLDMTLVYNRGAAFSFLSDAGGWQRWFFTAISVVMSIALVIWIRGLAAGHWLVGAGLALVLGGALGNLVDRVLLGHVVDFVSVHYREHYFPAFNLADSAITVGAGALILDLLLERKRGARHG